MIMLRLPIPSILTTSGFMFIGESNSLLKWVLRKVSALAINLFMSIQVIRFLLLRFSGRQISFSDFLHEFIE